jgi:PAS domain S-box-containing protein
MPTHALRRCVVLSVGLLLAFVSSSAAQPAAPTEHYRTYAVAAIVLLGLQTALIAGLVVQGARRRRSELALRESEERFRLMANGAPVMVWTARPDTTVDFLNSTVLEFTGLPVEQLLGNGWLRRVHPEDVDRCVAIYVPAFEARQPFHMEYRIRRADGTYRWVLDSGVPRYSADGSFAGYIGSALDITERREMEQSLLDNQIALQRAYERNQDLAGRLIDAQEAERARIARDLHDDLSQQLAGLAIMLSGLKRSVVKPDSQPEVELMVGSLQKRTSAIAEAVRNLSHELHPGVLKHAGLVATLRQHCAEVARHHGIAVTFTAPDEFAPVDFNAALCLYRVTQEALANVVRHARARGARVELREAGTGVELRVVDDGIGFVTDDRSGRGLGLQSIDERVRLIRGTLNLESQPGRGTNLLVQVPLAARHVSTMPES